MKKLSFLKRLLPLVACIVFLQTPVAGAEVGDSVIHLNPASVSTAKIYVPEELREMDLYASSSKWYYGRSKQSEHFILFWGKEYGQNGTTSPSDCPDEAFRVNIDDLLAKAEHFYDINVNKLKFVKPGASNTDKYKMMIFLIYQKEWLATGAGYDDKIGALWVSPMTCKPAGSVIAHEIGHSFQYMTFCDMGGKAGWRYGFGGIGGNGYWEQTAQWQSFMVYPEEALRNYYFKEYTTDFYHSTFHEEPRYANYFINYFWAYKNGNDFIGRLWRESGAKGEEDPAQAYMRIKNMSLKQYNDEQFEYACRMVTWDMDALRDAGKDMAGVLKSKLTQKDGEYWQVDSANCPENHGFNVIRLELPQAGTKVTARFAGLAGAAGYRSINTQSAGWRYGFVALKEDGSRIYGPAFSKMKGEATFTVPAGCSKLWFVVLGAPSRYWVHSWDDKVDNDEQWPYKVAFRNATVVQN